LPPLPLPLLPPLLPQLSQPPLLPQLPLPFLLQRTAAVPAVPAVSAVLAASLRRPALLSNIIILALQRQKRAFGRLRTKRLLAAKPNNRISGTNAFMGFWNVVLYRHEGSWNLRV
jgi:hypothetical protein